MHSAFSMHFLGVGNSHAEGLGSSVCVLERGADPLLLIDGGPNTITAYAEAQQRRLPLALFITHSHLDHIGGWRIYCTARTSMAAVGAGSNSLFQSG